MAFHICCHFPSLSIFLKVNQNMVTVVATAMVSATGSAGKLKDIIFHKYRQDVDQRDKGTMIFLNIARKELVLALPKATKVC